MKVEYIDHMGSDLSVVNAARVSFDKESKWVCCDDGCTGECFGGDYDHPQLSEADTRLIQFLARGITAEDFEKFIYKLDDATDFIWFHEGNTDKVKELLWEWRRTPEHFAPFAHPHVTFRIKAPIFVARQLGKHQVGMVWSEVSRRYVDGEPEFFVPEVWRKRAENVKQGSSYEAVEEDFDDEYRGLLYQARTLYEHMLANGCCPEQSRMVLPQSMMTEWIWTGSLYGWANVFNKRKPGSHAQRECWPIAEQIAEHMGKLFPVSWAALTGVTGG